MNALLEKLSQIEWLMRINQKDALDINECARFLGLSASHIRHLACTHQIPHYKRMGKLYFSKREMDEWKLAERVPTDEELRTIATNLF